MKIGPLDNKIASPPVAGDRKTAVPATPTGAAPSAKVELSTVATMKVDPEGEGSFDAAKVARMSAAIRDGRFAVDAGAIADKLLSNAQELLDHQRR